MIYRLGWALWWLSLALGLPTLGIAAWAYGNYVAGKNVEMVIVALMIVGALAVIGLGRLLRYVLSGD